MSAGRLDRDALRERFELIHPIVEDYQVAPVPSSFNWKEVVLDPVELTPTSDGSPVETFYLVAFRSLRKEDADIDRLIELDEVVNQDVKKRPGFLCYFKGELDGAKNCVSICVWTDRPAALQAVSATPHANAAALTSSTYVHYILERWNLHVFADRLEFQRLDETKPVYT